MKNYLELSMKNVRLWMRFRARHWTMIEHAQRRYRPKRRESRNYQEPKRNSKRTITTENRSCERIYELKNKRLNSSLYRDFNDV